MQPQFNPDARSMANAVLRTAIMSDTLKPSVESVMREYPAGRKALGLLPRETPLNPKPVEPSVLDWSAEWLHREVPALSDRECKRLILACVTRRELGKSLSVTETRWLQAWDKVISEGRAERTEEAGK
jgi:hypothetical protein